MTSPALLQCLFLLLNSVLVTSQITHPLVPHRVQEQRRGRRELEDSSVRRRTEAQQVGALYQGYGTHYVDLWCGSPPQRQTVIVDTGSGITAFPCDGCKNCGVPDYHIDQLFDKTASATFEENTCSDGCASHRSRCTKGKCKISMSYAEGSRWDATEVTDSCYIGGPHEVPLVADQGSEDIDPNHASHFSFGLVFGCQTMVTGLFKTQLADGIMGMDSRKEAYWSQMFRAGKMGDKKQFALCFSRQPTAQRKGTEAGALTLGGVDTRLHSSPMVFTPGASGGRDSFFSVKLRNVYLREGSAGESAKSNKANPSVGVHRIPVKMQDLNKGGIIVDSGTTDTYWNRAIAREFGALFKELAGRPHSNSAISLTDKQLAALPTIIFQLQSSKDANPDVDPFDTPGLAGSVDPNNPHDILLAFPPSHYMEYDKKSGKYTSRFYPTEGGGSVIGANSMMGHDVMFDSDNDRIGWAESDCDYTNLVTGAGFDFDITGELQEAPPTSATFTMAPLPPIVETVEPTGSPTMEAQNESPDDVTPPVPSPTHAQDSNDHGAGGKDNVSTGHLKEDMAKFLESCDSAGCRFSMFALVTVAATFGFCLSYMYNGRNGGKMNSDKYKYSRAPMEELELSNGEFSSYKDEPYDTASSNDSSGEQDAPPMPSSGFRDSEEASSKQPEFHGDFL